MTAQCLSREEESDDDNNNTDNTVKKYFGKEVLQNGNHEQSSAHVCVFLNGQELCTLETQISIPLGLEDP